MVRRTQVDTHMHSHTHTQQWEPWGYIRVAGRSLRGTSQEFADMLRFLLLTSLAALGKSCLTLVSFHTHIHTHRHAHQHTVWLLTRCLTEMLCVCVLSVLAELHPEPRYLEDEAVEERVVGGEVARANSWPWQVRTHFKYRLTLHTNANLKF